MLRVATERLVAPGSAGARRPELRSPAFTSLASGGRSMETATAILGEGCRPVRMILFDKTPESNWHVAWHQDPCIAVKAKADVPGYAGWSIKSGIPHVQPPASILEQMVTLRYHIDDTPADNGALWVSPRSHRQGRIPESLIPDMTTADRTVVCSAHAGDLLIMRPLLLHASQKATAASPHRRVIHIEYAGVDLPIPLEWSGIG